MAARKEISLYPYTITFNSDGVHMLGETSAGDCGHTIPRWKIPKIKKLLGLNPKDDLYSFLRVWPQERADELHNFFIAHSTEGVVYWDQDEFDRIYSP